MKILRVMAIGVTVGGFALAMNAEKAHAEEWTPRTVEAIKADVSKSNGNYTIVKGDHLWGISQATNITVQKLADMNKIANVDLIYEGNKLVFDGNVATVQNSNGETVAQSVIQPQDKVDSTKPVGQPVQDTVSNNTINSNNSATQNTTTTDNTVAGNTQTDGQTTGNTETTTPSTPENNGGTTQTPIQPDNNQTGSTGNTTTPSQPNTGGNQNNSGNSNGGTTTPSQPNNGGNQNGSTGGNSGTTTPSQPQAPTITAGQVGNSGMVFNTHDEAYDWGDAQQFDAESQWYMKRFLVSPIIYSDGSQKYTVDFFD
ncbi:LysM peptidoglycan-binding domain-containing protein [Enterococcus hirae]